MGRGDEGLQFIEGLGKVDFGGDDRVEPVFYDVPDTLEDPGGFVDEDDAEGFGVVGFEAFDHEFDGAVVLRRVSGLGEGLGEGKDRTIFAMEKSVMSNTIAWYVGQFSVIP